MERGCGKEGELGEKEEEEEDKVLRVQQCYKSSLHIH